MKLNRKKYLEIKKYDHETMERYLNMVFEKGKEEAAPQVPEKNRVREGIRMAETSLAETLKGTKGIGETRMEAILSGTRKRTEEKMNAWTPRMLINTADSTPFPDDSVDNS